MIIVKYIYYFNTKADYIMFYETNMGWVYITNRIYLKLEIKNTFKILRNIKKIEKINIKKKFIILKNIKNIKILTEYNKSILANKNETKIKDLSNIDYEVIEWMFYIDNVEKKYRNIEIGIIDVSINKWSEQIHKFKFESINIQIFRNKIEIEYDNSNIFMVYLYISAIKNESKIYSEETTILINNKEINWDVNNITIIKEFLKKNKKCIVFKKENFTYYIDILYENNSLLK